MKYIKTDMQKIGQQFNYESWIKIQEYLIKLFEVKQITTNESRYFLNYKKIPTISCENLINIAHVYPNKKDKNTFEKINLLEMIFVETLKKKVKKVYFIINNKYKLTPSNFYFFINCFSCDKKIELSYNPSRTIGDFNIPICKNCKKSILHKCKDYRETYENSMMLSYGVKRPLQSKQIHERFKEQMIKAHGVPYSGMKEEFLNKSFETTKKKYGTKCWIFGGSQLEEKIIREIKNNINKKFSFIEQSNKKEGILVGSKTYMYPDLVIKEINVIVEVFGDYWHANPELYDSSFISRKGLTRDQINAKDESRLLTLKNLGYEVIVIWELDWNKNKERELEKVINVINSKNFQF